MMMREWGTQVNVRVPLGMVQRMDRLVRTKNYRNRADIMLIALRSTVPSLESELKTKKPAKSRQSRKMPVTKSARKKIR